MRDRQFEKVYDELIIICKTQNLELHEFINFLLSFIILNLSASFDEEDARELCRGIYTSILQTITKRRCTNGGG